MNNEEMPLVRLGQGEYTKDYPQPRLCPGCGSPLGDCEDQACVRSSRDEAVRLSRRSS